MRSYKRPTRIGSLCTQLKLNLLSTFIALHQLTITYALPSFLLYTQAAGSVDNVSLHGFLLIVITNITYILFQTKTLTIIFSKAVLPLDRGAEYRGYRTLDSPPKSKTNIPIKLIRLCLFVN